jgi:8-oxo-dGTP diphosphatase
MAQSAALADWLAPWGPTEIVTSPWTRCRQTVAPRAQALGTDPEVLESLSEDRYAADPLRTEREIAERVTAGRSTLFCSHRPVLPAVLSTIGGRVGEAARGRLLPHAGMVVGGFAVLQLGQRADGSWLLLSHELHEPEQEN